MCSKLIPNSTTNFTNRLAILSNDVTITDNGEGSCLANADGKKKCDYILC